MFGKQRAGYRPEELEHLVVELKAPKVPIGRVEIGQIEGYVEAITNDSRFDTASTMWYFWALSREVDDQVMRLRQIQHAEPGVIIRRTISSSSCGHGRRLSPRTGKGEN